MASRVYQDAAGKQELRQKRRWFCADCKRRFVADDSAEFVDHRKIEHFDVVLDWRGEAKALFDYAMKFGPLAPTKLATTRCEIAVSRQDKTFLAMLVQGGFLCADEVERAIQFRKKVGAAFDQMVAESYGDRGFYRGFYEDA